MPTMIKVGNRIVNLDNLTTAQFYQTTVGTIDVCLQLTDTDCCNFDGDEADAVRWYLESQAADVEWLYRDHQIEEAIKEHGAEWARTHQDENSFAAWDNGGRAAAWLNFGGLAEEKDFVWRLGFSLARAEQQTTTE